MRDQNAVVLYPVISTTLLWIAVVFLLFQTIRKFLRNRPQMKALVMDRTGAVRDEYILGNQREILIGKSTPVNLVNIDFSDSEYASTIEEEHACFQKSGALWYVLSNAENGKVGLRQQGDEIVYKLRRGVPYRVNPGDIVYISYEKIILQKNSLGYGG